MKKYFLILVVLSLIGQKMPAQNLGIVFEENSSWSKAVKKAKAENKLIFVNCYSARSAPSKQLASQVFTQDKVGEFFNLHFVNVGYDMEKDADGKARLQSWGITSLPTLIFVDPATENPVGKLVGAGDARWLIEGAKMVLDPSKRIDALAARYNSGEREEGFLMSFIKALSQAGMTAQVQQVVKEWLESLPLDKLATKQVWLIIMQYENDPLSKTLLAVRDNISRFYAIPLENQRAMVDAKLAGAVVKTAMDFAMSPNLASYSQQRYNDFVDYVSQMPNNQGKAVASVWLNTSLLSRKGDWRQMLLVMRTVESEKILPQEIYGQYFVFFLKSLAQVKEKKEAVAEGLKWMDELIAKEQGETMSAYQMKASLYAGKASLWHELGKEGEMNKAQTEMVKYMELAKKSSSIVPANTRQEAGKAVLNYEERENVPIVKATINGHTYSFLFDTCAGYTCVSDRLVNAEQLPYQQTGNTIEGIKGSLQMATISELMLGGLTVKDQKAAVMSQQNQTFVALGVDGIIGVPIINNFVVSINAKNKTIVLGNEPENTIAQWDTLRFSGYNHPLLAIKVKGKDELYDVPALFDTGNGTKTIALPSAQGFKEWTDAGVIGNVENGQGFNALMINGIVKTTDKLYRGGLKELHIGGAAFQDLPIMTGGTGYLLMPFKITSLGEITLDYPRKRFHFAPYTDATVWKGDNRPVYTGVDNGVMKVAAVWGDEVAKQLEAGDTITAIGDKILHNLPVNAPNIDVLINQIKVTTVSVMDSKGVAKQLPAKLFLSKQ
ncbi:MAG: hypothetical protein BGN96_11200 [Bacteroidales bacterium 45-6]|nr:MAG: hypothetical protein BGN96_11200 [Bacteroidales bacterium 45-6]